jgi:putative PIN family toxin of toxin-antitoxin system
VNVVFDSNIFISALVFPGGRAEQAVLAVADGKCGLTLSKPIILEVLDVLARKFGRDADDLARTSVFLADLGHLVNPRKTIRALADEADKRILECAVAGHTDLIVTGDKAMLALAKYRNVEIITLKEFLTRVSSPR